MMGDGVQGIYSSVEERWEAASQGLMRLMEFCLEALEFAKDVSARDLSEAARHIKSAAQYTEAGALLMRQLGSVVSPAEYAIFRKQRDIAGSSTDQRIVDVHRKQKITSDHLFILLESLLEPGIPRALESSATQIFARNLIALNDAHRVVFASHRYVCTHVVPAGQESLRGGNIAELRIANLSKLIDSLRSHLKMNNHE